MAKNPVATSKKTKSSASSGLDIVSTVRGLAEVVNDHGLSELINRYASPRRLWRSCDDDGATDDGINADDASRTCTGCTCCRSRSAGSSTIGTGRRQITRGYIAICWHVLPQAKSRRFVLCAIGRQDHQGPGALHRRSDEADERN